MYKFIDLCCGFGSFTQAFKRTGLFECVLAADIDPNMRNHYRYLHKKAPLDDITSDNVQYEIKHTEYDVLVAGIGGLNENIFFQLLKTIKRDLPKAFVIEMGMDSIYYSMCNTLNSFCKKHQYHFVGFENKDVGNITLSLENFGVPNFCDRIYCVCIKKEDLKTKDEMLLQLQKKHDYNCYEYKAFDPDNNPEHLMGTDFGFKENFHFLLNTPIKNKKTIIEESTPIPMTMPIALDLGLNWLK